MITQLHRAVLPLAALLALFAIGCSGGAANPPAAATQASAPAAATQPGAPTAPQVSGNPTVSSGAPGYDCAALISEKEIDQLTQLSGTKLFSETRNQEELVPGFTGCSYQLPEGYVLVIEAWPPQAVESFDVVWNLVKDQGAQPVSGIGDGALLQKGDNSSVLFVRANGRGVRVSADDQQGSGKLDLNDLVKRVAAIVVGRV